MPELSYAALFRAAIEDHPSMLLDRLHYRLSFLPEYQSRHEELNTGFAMIGGISKILPTR